MAGVARYFKLFTAFARYALVRELTFRANFLVKLFVEVLWLGILLLFYRTVFAKTSLVAGWSEMEYLFFVGCYFALNGIIETLFLEGSSEFAELVRNGDLDFYLLRPVDEQFCITLRGIDWSTAPNVLLGGVLMLIALWNLDAYLDPVRVALFVVLFVCGVGLSYSFLVLLMSVSVWMVRNQSLYELWWLFTSLGRYPREIFTGPWASPLGLFFTYIVPVLLVVNVPAHTLVKAFDLPIILFTLAATAVLLFASRRFFQFALKSYRSASS